MESYSSSNKLLICDSKSNHQMVSNNCRLHNFSINYVFKCDVPIDISEIKEIIRIGYNQVQWLLNNLYLKFKDIQTL